tara:strand:+ start:110 stop:592 length:483 start_codon:yes stop_codon:yes gene_type:complete
MIKRLLAIAGLGVLLSGCYMVPMALVGPTISGYSTASIIQTGVTTGANYLVKQSTGKTIAEHAIDSLNKDIMQQSYAPNNKIKNKLKENYLPKNQLSSSCKKYDFYCKRILNKNPAAHSKLLKQNVPSVGCKKYDFYCKRMTREKWHTYIKYDQGLLGSS